MGIKYGSITVVQMSNNCDLDIDDGKGLEGIEIIYRINSTQ